MSLAAATRCTGATPDFPRKRVPIRVVAYLQMPRGSLLLPLAIFTAGVLVYPSKATHAQQHTVTAARRLKKLANLMQDYDSSGDERGALPPSSTNSVDDVRQERIRNSKQLPVGRGAFCRGGTAGHGKKRHLRPASAVNRRGVPPAEALSRYPTTETPGGLVRALDYVGTMSFAMSGAGS